MHIQRFSHSLTGTTADIAITPVNTARAFIVVSVRTPTTGSSGDRVNIAPEFVDSGATVRLTRHTGTDTQLVEVQVVESLQFSVQHGSATTSGATATDTITAVDLSKSFVLINYRLTGSGNSTPSTSFFKGYLSNSTTVAMEKHAAGGSPASHLIRYQVVEIQGPGRVTHSSIALTAGNSSNQMSLPSVNTAKSFLVGSYMVGGERGDNKPRWTITNSTTATVTRVGTTGAVTVELYCVELPNIKVARHQIADIADPTNQTITTVNYLSTSMTLLSNTDSNTAWAFNRAMATSKLTTTTNVVVQVDDTTSTNVGELEVVQFLDVYSRGSVETLPTTNADLATIYTPTERVNVASANGTRVGITGSNYLIHQFKNVGNLSDAFTGRLTDARSSLAPSGDTVTLQVYNHDTPAWETVDTDTTTAADTNFLLEHTQGSGLANYYDADGILTHRVYQFYDAEA